MLPNVVVLAGEVPVGAGAAGAAEAGGLVVEHGAVADAAQPVEGRVVLVEVEAGDVDCGNGLETGEGGHEEDKDEEAPERLVHGRTVWKAGSEDTLYPTQPCAVR